MRFTAPGIVVSLRSHGEVGGVVRLFTAEHGLQAAYVHGAKGRRMRPVLVPGNQVEASLRTRTEGQLAIAIIELLHSRAPLLREALPAAAIDWACALSATVLPEGQPYGRLYIALDGLLGAIEAAPAASEWGAALVRFELLLLAELGFGLDLHRCAVSGDRQDLVAVSPRSGRAIGSAAAASYQGKLLPLPSFIREGGQAGWSDIIDGLTLSGHFLMRDLLSDRATSVASARERLIWRLHRAAGLA